MEKNVLIWLENRIKVDTNKVAYAEKDGTSIDYSSLADMSERIGSALSCVEDKKPIAVICRRHVSTIAAFLGVVYSGHAYAPIDGKMPINRIKAIIEVLRPSTILADEENLEVAEEIRGYCDATLFRLEEISKSDINETKLIQIRNSMVMTDPLYVIFTSGSTGKPKGVITSHQSLMCYIESYTRVMRIDSDDVLGNQSPLDYIAAIRDIYLPLYTGCSTVIIPKEYFMQPDVLFEYMNQHQITAVGWSVSALTILSSLGAFEDSKPEYLKKVCFSGSVMPCKCLSQWQSNLPDTKFVNQYGPTEATASCTYYEVNHRVTDEEVLPIGTPYYHYRVFLLNEDLTPTKVGEIGEICVSGPILALGYYNDEERTAKSFTRNPNCEGYPELMYMTGDYGRVRKDGLLEFRGRKDRQIKHLGHRIELDEVECAANVIDGIDDSVCLYNNEKEVLYLFYSGHATVRDISIELRKVLPEFMVPRKIRQLDTIPKLPNGKIDMNTLKENMK